MKKTFCFRSGFNHFLLIFSLVSYTLFGSNLHFNLQILVLPFDIQFAIKFDNEIELVSYFVSISTDLMLLLG
jgi:hypothetical protein